MNPNNRSHKAHPIHLVNMIAGLACLTILVGCGGGGGSGSTDSPVNPPQTLDSVAISGTVDDGTENSPISNATCIFRGLDGIRRRPDIKADVDGNFSLTMLPDTQGNFSCYPPNTDQLSLSTFLSTVGLAGGDELAGEDVTPATTVVARIIQSENPADPEARKQELLEAIANGQDPGLNRLVDASTTMYKRLLGQGINVDFGGGEGGAGGGDGGGVGGGAGDGGDASPIAGARCEFTISKDLKSGEVLHTAALDDLLKDGEISRADLESVREEINQSVEGFKGELEEAYQRFFKNGGIGLPLAATADDNGEYFIETPPGVPGFVRCYPPDKDQLVLATYVPARQAGSDLLGQDVDPATTLFSNNVAARLLGVVDEGNLEAIKTNYLADTQALGLVHVVTDNDAVVDFQIQDPGNQVDNDVSMVAFTATSLYLSYFKNGINEDYIDAIGQVTTASNVDSVDIGLPQAQVDVLSASVNVAAAQLNTGLGLALEKARVRVTVTDGPGGSPVENASVAILDPESLGSQDAPLLPGCEVNGISDSDCFAATDSTGKALLTVRPAPAESTATTVQVSGEGFLTRRVTTQIVALATVDIEVALEPSEPTTLSNASAALAGLNDCADPAGGLPYSTYILGFDFSDANGDANQDAGARLDVDYQFVGGRAFQEDQTAALGAADGFGDTVRFETCIRFDNMTILGVTFTLVDGDGNPSNALPLAIVRPTGAN